jgi:hypothetical protein
VSLGTVKLASGERLALITTRYESAHFWPTIHPGSETDRGIQAHIMSAAELELVDVEGWKAWVLRDTLEPTLNSNSEGVINLLPLFDALLICLGRGQDIDPLISVAHQKHVFRPQGWISAVVLVDGLRKGVWEHQFKPADFILKTSLFTSLSHLLRKKIATEAEHLGRLLNKKVSPEFSIIS